MQKTSPLRNDTDMHFAGEARTAAAILMSYLLGVEV
jgi:hypothetical protein